MQRHKLARVRWQVGQTLLPEHFRAQDEALSSEARLHAELSGLPQVGIASFAWSEALLAEGSLSVSALTAVLPGGFLVDVPGNAVIPPLSLEATGRAEVTVHLHLLDETRGAEGVPLYADEPPSVQRYLSRLQLSSEQSVDRALSSMELVAFSKNLEGAWRPAARKVPPLLLVGANPFLNELLSELDLLLEKAHGQLRTLLLDSYQRSERLASARRTLLEVRRLQSLRSDMRGGICPHPYSFFDALRRFYFEVCCYLELEPDGALPAYRHDELGAGLWGWMDLLNRAFRPEDTRLTYKPFESKEGQFVLTPLPTLDEGVQSELYLLVRSEDPSRPPSMEGVKVASPSRLSSVRRLALRGIPFQHVPHPAFPHAFGPEISWYKLSLGEEWQYALRDNGMAFYVTPALQGTQVFLFWRRA
ncbi:type VI secretion system baseplate subunit TssK [Stigmatella sp. ncwal1]|uniref:Type VI secretion system baseplate subunit TssK n=1 Tax=Stigmatella ashevillensis TaxID=2995309 RepID=A0ABT5DIW0_9BACT|nr:type VI secretion system baseplate subunit TssK [Stigmatella ashevillena]MDC0713587.1 type VI secretion system baseplate subunit TssK [Stigmatella ashevillena]